MKKFRFFISMMLVLMLSAGFSTVAFAGGGEDTGEPAEVPIIPIAEPEKEPTKPLTPDGNLTLVDDVTTNDATEKQFITAVSKNGNYFYLVIDRAGEKDNVYLLNLIDEADLMALMDGEKVTVKTEPEPTPPTEKESEPTEPEKPVEKPKNSTLPLLVLLIALGGGGVFYYLKFIKGKKSTGGNGDINDFADEDEDEDEYRTEDAFEKDENPEDYEE